MFEVSLQVMMLRASTVWDAWSCGLHRIAATYKLGCNSPGNDQQLLVVSPLSFLRLVLCELI